MQSPFTRKRVESLFRVAPWTRNFLSSVFPTFSPSSARKEETTPEGVTYGTESVKVNKEVTESTAVVREMEWQSDPHDKALLRSTWSDDFETLYDLGSDIYTYIFKQNPACKQLFPWIAKYEGDKWRDSKEFRAQALRFVQTIAHVVKNVYHMERLESYLYDIGQRHVKFAKRGFRPEHWDIFQDAMEVALTNRMKHLPELSEADRQRSILVWRDMALYIITHMKSGYNDGLKGINRFPVGIVH